MKFGALPHRWSVAPRRAVEIQREMAGRVRRDPLRGEVRRVVGIDAAFSQDGTQCIAAAVLWDCAAREVVEIQIARRPLRFPYVPGLLSFREGPAIVAALRKLRAEPDVLMFDGHGLAHPRRLGIACHIGVLVDRPSMGCGKSRLVGEHREPGNARGKKAPLTHRGERIGTVLRSQDGVRPLFISVGHRISLAQAERLALATTDRYRLPEPTRLADRAVARVKRGHSPLKQSVSSSSSYATTR